METTVKKQTVFRFSEELMIRIKREAKKQNRSINNFVETILSEVLCKEPNEETIKAINDAKSGRFAGTLDMSDFDAFMKSVNSIQ